MLRDVCRQLSEMHFAIANVDATIVAQAPKMLPHINKMKTTLSEDMQIAPADINIKATTTERMGYIGREEGLAVHAVCLINPT